MIVKILCLWRIYQVFIFDDIFSEAHSHVTKLYMSVAKRYFISTSPKLSLKSHHDADLIRMTRLGQLLNKAVSASRMLIYIYSC